MGSIPTGPVHGVLAAMVTPLSADGRQLDLAALGPYLRWLAEHGVDGVFVGGTTGEGPLLSAAERAEVLGAVLAARPTGLGVVAHVGAATTAEAIALAQGAAAAGADAVAAVTPWFYALDAAALTAFFVAVGQAAAPLPLFLYNIPAAGRNVVTPEVVTAVARALPTLAGIKDSGGDLVLLRAAAAAGRAACAGGFSVFCGADALALAALADGADGIVSGNASTVPEPLVALARAAAAGDWVAARRHQTRIDEVAAALGRGWDIGLFKAVLAARGVAVGGPRPPLPARDPAQAATALQRLGPL